ncbi:hypothetical protein PRJH_p072 (plasmid) [Providencia rustigianii]
MFSPTSVLATLTSLFNVFGDYVSLLAFCISAEKTVALFTFILLNIPNI